MDDYAMGINIRRFVSNTGQLREFVISGLEECGGQPTPFMQGYRDSVCTSRYQNTVDKRFLRKWDKLTGQLSPDMCLPREIRDLEPVVRDCEGDEPTLFGGTTRRD